MMRGYFVGVLLVFFGQVVDTVIRESRADVRFDVVRRLVGWRAAVDEEVAFWRREQDIISGVAIRSLAWPAWLAWSAWQRVRRRRP